MKLSPQTIRSASRQQGFLPIAMYGAIAAVVVIGVLSVSLRIQTNRLDAVKQEYAAFQANVKALGEVADKQARAKEKADIATKEKIDADHKKTVATLLAESRRVRDFNSSRGGLSGIPASPSRPDLACFDRAELDTAIRLYQSDLLGIAEKGAQATLDLNTGKDWVKLQAVK